MTEVPKDSSGSGKGDLSRFGIQNNAPLSICPVKLDGSNYLLWSRSFTFAITARGLLKFITDPIPHPAATSPYFGIWTSQNALAITWLFNAMIPTISFLDTLHKVWASRAQTHSQKRCSCF